MTLLFVSSTAWAFFGWLVSAPIGARPIVIHDAGGTLPLAPFYEAVGLDDTSFRARKLQKPSISQKRIERLRATVRSMKLSPGVQPRKPSGAAGRLLPHPLFLVGADSLSLSWLHAVKARLMELGAVGLIVDSSGPDDLARIRAVADGLILAIGSGDDIADRFGISHYPVLIGPEWIER